MSETKTNIYTWIKYMCTNNKLNITVPVMFALTTIQEKFNISDRQAKRIMKSLEEEGKIYRIKVYNNITLYSISPIDTSGDLFVRVRP